MRAWLLLVAVLAGCGSAPSAPVSLREVVLYRNGIGYFERRGAATGSVGLEVREHELDDVLTTLTVSGADGREVAPAAVLPDRAAGGETARLRVSVGEARDVRVSYAAQTSAWRASYRLVLPDGRGTGDATLQGWAVIDNTTAEDWRDVRITLATAAPLSFAVDLRTPRIVPRPDVTGYASAPIAFGAVVAERGAVDHDHDGILDARDECPEDAEQTNGFEDEDGCPDRGRVVIENTELRILERVFFAPGSSELAEQSLPLIDAVAQTLRAQPEIRRVEVHGHADRGEESPFRLSAERAAVVRRALMDREIAGDRLDIVPHGDTQPLDGSGTDAGRARNRRVEYVVAEMAVERAASGVRAEDLRRTAHGPVLPSASSGTRYVLRRRVSVPAGRSAMVAMIAGTLSGEDVLLFRPDPAVPSSDAHPFRAARIRNGDTELVAGPITLFARGELLGQGLLEGLLPGEGAFVPYAVADGTRVEVAVTEEEEPARLLSIHDGEVRVERTRTRRTQYVVTPSGRVPARIFLRHARAAGYETGALPPGAERTREALILPMPITSGRESTLAVDEARPVIAEVALDGDLEVDLGRYAVDAGLDPATRAQLDAILADRQFLADLGEQIAALHARLTENAVRAAELRRSVAALGEAGPAGARRRLAQTLERAVADAEALAADLAELRAREAEVREHLRAAVRGFDAG